MSLLEKENQKSVAGSNRKNLFHVQDGETLYLEMRKGDANMFLEKLSPAQRLALDNYMSTKLLDKHAADQRQVQKEVEARIRYFLPNFFLQF